MLSFGSSCQEIRGILGTGKDIDDVESYRGVHPTIVMDKERHIEVLVAGERQDTSEII